VVGDCSSITAKATATRATSHPLRGHPADHAEPVGLLFALHPWVAYAFVAGQHGLLRAAVRVFLASHGRAVAGGAGPGACHGRARAADLGRHLRGAWIAQFVGHKLEGKKPSFFEDLQYLWVGPIFVLSKLFLKLGVRW
jgi:uncharacterized membrane protein YGL010W